MLNYDPNFGLPSQLRPQMGAITEAQLPYSDRLVPSQPKYSHKLLKDAKLREDYYSLQKRVSFLKGEQNTYNLAGCLTEANRWADKLKLIRPHPQEIYAKEMGKRIKFFLDWQPDFREAGNLEEIVFREWARATSKEMNPFVLEDCFSQGREADLSDYPVAGDPIPDNERVRLPAPPDQDVRSAWLNIIVLARFSARFGGDYLNSGGKQLHIPNTRQPATAVDPPFTRGIALPYFLSNLLRDGEPYDEWAPTGLNFGGAFLAHTPNHPDALLLAANPQNQEPPKGQLSLNALEVAFRAFISPPGTKPIITLAPIAGPADEYRAWDESTNNFKIDLPPARPAAEGEDPPQNPGKYIRFPYNWVYQNSGTLYSLACRTLLQYSLSIADFIFRDYFVVREEIERIQTEFAFREKRSLELKRLQPGLTKAKETKCALRRLILLAQPYEYPRGAAERALKQIAYDKGFREGFGFEDDLEFRQWPVIKKAKKNLAQLHFAFWLAEQYVKSEGRVPTPVIFAFAKVYRDAHEGVGSRGVAVDVTELEIHAILDGNGDSTEVWLASEMRVLLQRMLKTKEAQKDIEKQTFRCLSESSETLPVQFSSSLKKLAQQIVTTAVEGFSFLRDSSSRQSKNKQDDFEGGRKKKITRAAPQARARSPSSTRSERGYGQEGQNFKRSSSPKKILKIKRSPLPKPPASAPNSKKIKILKKSQPAKSDSTKSYGANLSKIFDLTEGGASISSSSGCQPAYPEETDLSNSDQQKSWGSASTPPKDIGQQNFKIGFDQEEEKQADPSSSPLNEGGNSSASSIHCGGDLSSRSRGLERQPRAPERHRIDEIARADRLDSPAKSERLQRRPNLYSKNGKAVTPEIRRRSEERQPKMLPPLSLDPIRRRAIIQGTRASFIERHHDLRNPKDNEKRKMKNELIRVMKLERSKKFERFSNNIYDRPVGLQESIPITADSGQLSLRQLQEMEARAAANYEQLQDYLFGDPEELIHFLERKAKEWPIAEHEIPHIMKETEFFKDQPEYCLNGLRNTIRYGLRDVRNPLSDLPPQFPLHLDHSKLSEYVTEGRMIRKPEEFPALTPAAAEECFQGQENEDLREIVRRGLKIDQPSILKAEGNFDNLVRTPVSEDISLAVEDLFRRKIITRVKKVHPEMRLNRLRAVHNPGKEARITLDTTPINKFLPEEPVKLDDPFTLLASGKKYFTKIDLKKCFHMIKLEEKTKDLFCFVYNDVIYRFERLVMGLSISPGLCSRIMQAMLARIKKNYTPHPKVKVFNKKIYSSNFLDDTGLCNEDPEHLHSFSLFATAQLTRYGATVNDLKSTLTPQLSIIILGFKLEKGRVSVPQEKREEIIRNITEFLRSQLFTHFRRLVGQLQFCAVPDLLLRPQLPALRKEGTPRMWTEPDYKLEGASIYVSTRLRTKLQGIAKRIKKGVAFDLLCQNERKYGHPPHFQIAVDATQEKYGFAMLGDRTPLYLMKDVDYLDKNRPIHLLEMHAIEIALKKAPKRCRLEILSDSQSAISAVKKGSSQDPEVNAVIARIFAIALAKKILFILTWIQSEENPADAATRPKIWKARGLSSSPWSELFRVQASRGSRTSRESIISFFRKPAPHQRQPLSAHQIVCIKLQQRKAYLWLQKEENAALVETYLQRDPASLALLAEKIRDSKLLIRPNAAIKRLEKFVAEGPCYESDYYGPDHFDSLPLREEGDFFALEDPWTPHRPVFVDPQRDMIQQKQAYADLAAEAERKRVSNFVEKIKSASFDKSPSPKRSIMKELPPSSEDSSEETREFTPFKQVPPAFGETSTRKNPGFPQPAGQSSTFASPSKFVKFEESSDGDHFSGGKSSQASPASQQPSARNPASSASGPPPAAPSTHYTSVPVHIADQWERPGKSPITKLKSWIDFPVPKQPTISQTPQQIVVNNYVTAPAACSASAHPPSGLQPAQPPSSSVPEDWAPRSYRQNYSPRFQDIETKLQVALANQAELASLQRCQARQEEQLEKVHKLAAEAKQRPDPSQDLQLLENKVAKIREEISKLQADILSHHQNLGPQELEIKQIVQRETAAAQQTLLDLDRGFASLQQDLPGMKLRIAALEMRPEAPQLPPNLVRNVSSLQEELASLHEALSQKSSIANTNAILADLSNKITSVQTNANTKIATEYEKLAISIAGIEGRVKELEKKSNESIEEIQKNDKRILALEKEAATFSSNLTSLSSSAAKASDLQVAYSEFLALSQRVKSLEEVDPRIGATVQTLTAPQLTELVQLILPQLQGYKLNGVFADQSQLQNVIASTIQEQLALHPALQPPVQAPPQLQLPLPMIQAPPPQPFPLDLVVELINKKTAPLDEKIKKVENSVSEVEKKVSAIDTKLGKLSEGHETITKTLADQNKTAAEDQETLKSALGSIWEKLTDPQQPAATLQQQNDAPYNYYNQEAEIAGAQARALQQQNQILQQQAAVVNENPQQQFENPPALLQATAAGIPVQSRPPSPLRPQLTKEEVLDLLKQHSEEALPKILEGREKVLLKGIDERIGKQEGSIAEILEMQAQQAKLSASFQEKLTNSLKEIGSSIHELTERQRDHELDLDAVAADLVDLRTSRTLLGKRHKAPSREEAPSRRRLAGNDKPEEQKLEEVAKRPLPPTVDPAVHAQKKKVLQVLRKGKLKNKILHHLSSLQKKKDLAAQLLEEELTRQGPPAGNPAQEDAPLQLLATPTSAAGAGVTPQEGHHLEEESQKVAEGI